MAHELKPRSGQLPSANEIARLLAAEFAYTKTNEAEGIRRALALAEWIERAPANLFFGRHQEALAHAAKLKRLAPGEALEIEFGDAPEEAKRIVVLPDEPISFGYGSKDEETASRELVERCAQALDCEVVLI